MTPTKQKVVVIHGVAINFRQTFSGSTKHKHRSLIKVSKIKEFIL